MSQVPQIQEHRDRTFGGRFVLAMGVVVAIAVGPYWRGVLSAASHAHPHAPDPGRFGQDDVEPGLRLS